MYLLNSLPCPVSQVVYLSVSLSGAGLGAEAFYAVDLSSVTNYPPYPHHESCLPQPESYTSYPTYPPYTSSVNCNLLHRLQPTVSLLPLSPTLPNLTNNRSHSNLNPTLFLLQIQYSKVLSSLHRTLLPSLPYSTPLLPSLPYSTLLLPSLPYSTPQLTPP